MTRDGLTRSVIAVDGGGSTCRLVLDGPGGRYLAERGSANVSSDFAAALGEIRTGLAALAAQAGTDLAGLADVPAYVGLAGVTGPAKAEAVRAALPLARVRVEDDRRSALRGALGAHDGAIAHFGTGSFFALQSGAELRLAGGWGSRLGDEGSGYWVVRSALTETLASVDGLIAPSPLTEALLAAYGSAAEIVARVAVETPRETARLAPEVAAAAAAGDPVGARILQEGADHIALTLARMGWRDGMDLCLTGGFGPSYRDFLPDGLAEALV